MIVVFYKGPSEQLIESQIHCFQMLFEMKVRHRLAISECVEFGIARFDGHLRCERNVDPQQIVKCAFELKVR